MEVRNICSPSKVFNHQKQDAIKEVYSFYDSEKHMLANEFIEQNSCPRDISRTINAKCLDLLLLSENNLFSDVIKDFTIYDLDKNGIDELINDLKLAKIKRQKISIYLGCSNHNYHSMEKMYGTIQKVDCTLFNYIDGLGINLSDRFSTVNACISDPPIFKNLKKLLITGSGDTERLKNIGCFNYLETVILNNCLDDKAISYLKSIKNLKLLRYRQDIFRYDVVEQKVFLTALKQLTKLKFLELSLNDIPNSFGIDQLGKSLPNTIIITKNKPMIIKFEKAGIVWEIHNQ